MTDLTEQIENELVEKLCARNGWRHEGDYDNAIRDVKWFMAQLPFICLSLAASTGEELELKGVCPPEHKNCHAKLQREVDLIVLTEAKAIIAAQKVEIDKLKIQWLKLNEICQEHRKTDLGLHNSLVALSSQQEEKHD